MRRYQKGSSRASTGQRSIQVELNIDADQFERMIVEGLHGMALEVGIEVAQSLIADEVEQRCGPANQRSNDRKAYRYGSQSGFIRMGGQRIGLKRPRVRSIGGSEIELQMYRRLQRESGESAVMRRVVRGVSCRDYKLVIDAIRRGRGISSSSVSRSFVDASTERVRQLAERGFHGVRFVAILIDGVVFARETVVTALGVTAEGEKRILALRHGATENASICVDLLKDLRDRGVSTEQRTLFVIDGSRALRTAIREVWGEFAIVQRCQVHKLRNVQGYVPKKHWLEAKSRIQKAYADSNYRRAKRSLETISRWLAWINPHAATSLRDGLDETLTVSALGLSGSLRRSLTSTNMIESIFSRARMMTGRVKRWRSGGMRQRWCATALIHAERGFNRVHGYADIAEQLLPRLDAMPLRATQSA
jgi:putative transposase